LHRRAALLHRRSARIATRCNDRRMKCSATARAQACEALAHAEAPEAAGSLSRLLKLLCTDDEPRVRVRDGPRQRSAARSLAEMRPRARSMDGWAPLRHAR
jgi:hypothetical protein